MSFVVVSNWAKREFAKVQVWDKRCRRSLMKMAQAIDKAPMESFSAACGSSRRQCGTRIFGNKQMKPENFQAGHYQETVKRASKCREVIVAQDTSSFNYTSHRATTGLGQISTSSNAVGIHMHTCLVMRSDGLPLGLVGQKLWVRDPAQAGKRHRRKELPIEEKESHKWIEGIRFADEQLTSHVEKIWVVSDRESDIFEYMQTSRSDNVFLLLRAVYPRIVEATIEGNKHKGRLDDILKILPEQATKAVDISKSNKTELVTLSLSYINITMYSPGRQGRAQETMSMGLIYAREKKPSKTKKEPIEWILFCSCPVENEEEASKMVDYYSRRWQIERFHFTLKTGVFNVERLQFDDADTLMNALSFYSILAWKTLYITYYGRYDPETKAEEIIDKTEKTILQRATKRKIHNAQDALMAIGILGGFLGGTKRYPYPGIKSIWMGLVILETMKQGWLLAKGTSIKFYATG